MLQLTRIPLVLVAAILLTSCASNKAVNKGKVYRNAKPGALYESLATTQPQFTWYSGKARIRASNDDMRVGGTIHLRMRKDSAIWIQAEKLGFEIGRTLITPDSVFIIDRLNKIIQISPFEEFMADYKAPFSFSDLQNILAGGGLVFTPITLNAERDDPYVRLTMSNATLKALYWFGDNLLVNKGRIMDWAGRSVDLEFSDYRTVESAQEVPFQRFIAIDDGESTTEATFTFSEIQVDVPKSMSFDIPSHYLRID